MPTTVDLTSILTEDAQPGVAPHRISRDPAKDDVTVAFVPTNDGNLVPSDDLIPIEGAAFPDTFYPDTGVYPDPPPLIPGLVRDTIGWEVRQGDRTTGRLVASAPAGLRIASGEEVQVTFPFSAVDDGGADGSRVINIYVHTDSQGWW